MEGQESTPNTEGQQVGQDNQSNQQPAQSAQPTQPFAIFPDSTSFNARLDREVRKNNEKLAKDLGYESFDAMKSVIPQRQQAQPAQSAQPDNRLQTALAVAVEMNLPSNLVNRLQGNTPEEMKADAESLMKLLGGAQQQPAKPTIPNAPTGSGQPATFTRAQMSNPVFVRENQAAIMQAAREGRIL